MKTMQITIDDTLLEELDQTAEGLKRTRSTFVREALKEAIEKVRVEELDRQHREGYKKHPIKRGEFDLWEDEQHWGA